MVCWTNLLTWYSGKTSARGSASNVFKLPCMICCHAASIASAWRASIVAAPSPPRTAVSFITTSLHASAMRAESLRAWFGIYATVFTSAGFISRNQRASTRLCSGDPPAESIFRQRKFAFEAIASSSLTRTLAMLSLEIGPERLTTEAFQPRSIDGLSTSCSGLISRPRAKSAVPVTRNRTMPISRHRRPDNARGRGPISSTRRT